MYINHKTFTNIISFVVYIGTVFASFFNATFLFLFQIIVVVVAVSVFCVL